MCVKEGLIPLQCFSVGLINQEQVASEHFNTTFFSSNGERNWSNWKQRAKGWLCLDNTLPRYKVHWDEPKANTAARLKCEAGYPLQCLSTTCCSNTGSKESHRGLGPHSGTENIKVSVCRRGHVCAAALHVSSYQLLGWCEAEPCETLSSLRNQPNVCIFPSLLSCVTAQCCGWWARLCLDVKACTVVPLLDLTGLDNSHSLGWNK